MPAGASRFHWRRSGRGALAAFSPTRLVTWGSVAIALSYALVVLRYAHARSHFVGDDLYGFWLGRTSSLPTFLMTPIDVHYVPLHRLVSYLFERVAPLNYVAALVVLSAFHAVGVLFLYRTLERVRATPLNWLLVALYTCHACLGPMFLWWTSGLHRLPYVCFSILSVYFYMGYRVSRSWRDLALVFACITAAVGFYSKGVLVPVYLAGVEAALGHDTPPRERRRNVAALAGTTVPTVAYFFLWRFATAAPMHALNQSVRFICRFVLVGFELLGPSCFGFWFDGIRWGAPVAGVLWLGGILFSLVRAPRSVVAWAALFVSIAANFALLAASGAKTALLGLSIVMVDRYYFELVFLVVLFTALAFRHVELPSWLRRLAGTAPRRWGAAVATLGLLLLVATKSAASFVGLARSVYGPGEVASRFARNLRQSLASLPVDARNPLIIEEGPVPPEIMPIGNLVRRDSEYLVLMGERVRVSPLARLRVAPTGIIVPRQGRARSRR